MGVKSIYTNVSTNEECQEWKEKYIQLLKHFNDVVSSYENEIKEIKKQAEEGYEEAYQIILEKQKIIDKSEEVLNEMRVCLL